MYLLYEDNVKDQLLGEKNSENKYTQMAADWEQEDNLNTKFQKETRRF